MSTRAVKIHATFGIADAGAKLVALSGLGLVGYGALPLHYPFGLATIGHLGLVYLDAAILLIGMMVAYREMGTR